MNCNYMRLELLSLDLQICLNSEYLHRYVVDVHILNVKFFERENKFFRVYPDFGNVRSLNVLYH